MPETFYSALFVCGKRLNVDFCGLWSFQTKLEAVGPDYWPEDFSSEKGVKNQTMTQEDGKIKASKNDGYCSL